MSDFKVRVESHIGDVMVNVNSRAKLALAAMGEVVEGYAKEDCPVDTGRLRNSITHQASVDGNEPCELVGSAVEYAPAQEFTDSYHHTVGKAHFLRDAAEDHVNELRDTAQTIFYAP